MVEYKNYKVTDGGKPNLGAIEAHAVAESMMPPPLWHASASAFKSIAPVASVKWLVVTVGLTPRSTGLPLAAPSVGKTQYRSPFPSLTAVAVSRVEPTRLLVRARAAPLCRVMITGIAIVPLSRRLLLDSGGSPACSFNLSGSDCCLFDCFSDMILTSPDG